MLELIAGDDTCPVQTSCTGSATVAPGAAGVFTVREPLASCYTPPRFVAQTDAGQGNFTIQPVNAAVPGAGSNCPTFAAGGNGAITLRAAVAPWAAPAAFTDPDPAPPGGENPRVWLLPVKVARYAIAPDVDGQPALWRSATGVYLPDGTAGTVAPPGGNWQMVARGIEDLQVEYDTMAGMLAGAGWTNAPAVQPTPGVIGSVVMRVRVTLSARALTPVLMAGATNQAAGGAGGAAVRGQLVSVIAPRAAAFAAQWARNLQ
jgi:hypothetical protein